MAYRSSTKGCVIVAAIAMLAPLTADAQIIQAPPRSTPALSGGPREVDPERTRTELTMAITALGGWDDNLAPNGTDIVIDPHTPRTGSYSGLTSAELTLVRTREGRSLQASGRAFHNVYSTSDVGALTGGDATVSTSLKIRRRGLLAAKAFTQYEPTFTLGAFAALGRQVDSGVIADADRTIGVERIGLRRSGLVVDFSQEWNARHRTVLTSDLSRQNFLEGPVLDNQSQSAAVTHDWNFSRRAGFNIAYRYLTALTDVPDGAKRPFQTQGTELGFELRRALSRTRRLTFRAGAGAMHVRNLRSLDNSRFEYISPSGFGSARADLGRTWSAAADFRRSVTVLEALALHSFATNASTITLGGELGRRLSATVSGAYSTGEARSAETGSYAALNSAFQLQTAVASWCSMVTTYSYYSHRLRNVAAVPSGLPTRFERSAVRVGLSILLPLHGRPERN
jgi:hypothetical protein